jgi:hypothetical protein
VPGAKHQAFETIIHFLFITLFKGPSPGAALRLLGRGLNGRWKNEPASAGAERVERGAKGANAPARRGTFKKILEHDPIYSDHALGYKAFTI